jgi:hypothetical protein
MGTPRWAGRDLRTTIVLRMLEHDNLSLPYFGGVSLKTFAEIIDQAREARNAALELQADSLDPAVQTLITVTLELADELEALAIAIAEMGGRIETHEELLESPDPDLHPPLRE